MELKAQKREVTGKKVKRLRKEGKVPAVVFGAGKESQPLTLDLHEFERVYKGAGESTIIDLDISGKKETVLIADLQYDPVGKLLHADLQRVAAGEVLTATVAIEPIDESPAVAEGKGILLTLLDEVEVECFPQDLPSEIKVDISNLKEVDDVVAIKDLPIDKEKVKILDHEKDEPVLKIDYAEMQEEEEVEEKVSEEEAVAAVEAEKEKVPEEEGPSSLKAPEGQGKPKAGEKEKAAEKKPEAEEKKG